MPLVSSQTECEYVIDQNLISTADCVETHKVSPTARGGPGTTTTEIQQHLKMISVFEPVDLEALKSAKTSVEEDDWGGKMSDNKQVNDEEDTILPEPVEPISAEVISTALENITRRESLIFRHDEYHNHHLGQTPNDYEAAKMALSRFCGPLKVWFIYMYFPFTKRV